MAKCKVGFCREERATPGDSFCPGHAEAWCSSPEIRRFIGSRLDAAAACVVDFVRRIEAEALNCARDARGFPSSALDILCPQTPLCSCPVKAGAPVFSLGCELLGHRSSALSRAAGDR